MLAVGEKHIQTLDLLCNLDGRSTTKAIIKHTGESPYCKLASYLIDCQTDAQPAAFYLVGSNDKRHRVSNS